MLSKVVQSCGHRWGYVDCMQPEEIARRIRAARAYAGLSQKELGLKVQMHAQTIKRYENADDPENTPNDGRLTAIAVACGLPASWFSEAGMELPLPPEELRERLRRIEDSLELLLRSHREDTLDRAQAVVQAAAERGAQPRRDQPRGLDRS